jgi:hypothetical protein
VGGVRWEFRGWERVVQCGRLDKFLVDDLSRISAMHLLHRSPSNALALRPYRNSVCLQTAVRSVSVLLAHKFAGS